MGGIVYKESIKLLAKLWAQFTHFLIIYLGTNSWNTENKAKDKLLGNLEGAN